MQHFQTLDPDFTGLIDDEQTKLSQLFSVIVQLMFVSANIIGKGYVNNIVLEPLSQISFHSLTRDVEN